MTSNPRSMGICSRVFSTARRCRACTLSAPKRLRTFPISPEATPPSRSRVMTAPVTAESAVAMVSWPSFSGRVMAAISESMRLKAGLLFRHHSRAVCFFYPVWQGRPMALDGSKTDVRRDDGAGLVSQLSMMIRALLASPVRNTLFLLGALISTVIAATAYGQIRLNRWNQPFYDALAHRDFHEFLMQLGVFGVIVGALLVL